MRQPIAFFCRAKPQGADAFEIFRQAGYAFIGYPLLRRNRQYDPNALADCYGNPTCPQGEWQAEVVGRPNRRAYNRNRNFIPHVTKDSIVVVPRPERALAYVAYVTGPFEIVNSPGWLDDYLALRAKQGKDVDDQTNQHAGDVSHGWPVDEYRPVSLSQFPGWLRKSMLGRSTYGLFRDHPMDGSRTAHACLSNIIAGWTFIPQEWTTDNEEVKRRVLDFLTPSTFEHLVVSLLQLEHPKEIWQQTGGPGDGGIDGLGSNGAGKAVAILQCKYEASRTPEIGEGGPPNSYIRRYAAVLLPEDIDPPTDGTEFINLDWIAQRVLKHRNRLPLALTLMVGEPCAS
jgi:hypothetical protein